MYASLSRAPLRSSRYQRLVACIFKLGYFLLPLNLLYSNSVLSGLMLTRNNAGVKIVHRGCIWRRMLGTDKNYLSRDSTPQARPGELADCVIAQTRRPSGSTGGTCGLRRRSDTAVTGTTTPVVRISSAASRARSCARLRLTHYGAS